MLGSKFSGESFNFGAVVERRQEKGRLTKGRRRHKVDTAPKRQKADDIRSIGLEK
jgi:hypothetical protein